MSFIWPSIVWPSVPWIGLNTNHSIDIYISPDLRLPWPVSKKYEPKLLPYLKSWLILKNPLCLWSMETCRSGNPISIWTGQGTCTSLCWSGEVYSENCRWDKRRSDKRRSAICGIILIVSVCKIDVWISCFLYSLEICFANFYKVFF